MKRLGMWTRAGIVLTVLWLTIVPVVNTMNYEKAIGRVQEALRQRCLDGNWTNAHCSQYRGISSDEFWHYWLGSLQQSLIIAVVAWVLAWAAIRTVRWVWAGRST